MTQYQSGFGKSFGTEALPGAMPEVATRPQRCPYGLYAEQLSGTSFTALRADNRRFWRNRNRPPAMHTPFERIDSGPS
jgi:homogentisate 1,2-dioxygenase